MPDPLPIVLIELGQTLGFETRSTEFSDGVRLTVYPGVRESCAELRLRARLGALVAGPGWSRERLKRVLRSAGPPEFARLFDDNLLIAAADAPRARLEAVAAQAKEAGVEAVLVSSSATLRATGIDAGLRVAAHPALAESALDGLDLSYFRVTARGIAPEALRDVFAAKPVALPLLVLRAADGATIYGLGPTATFQRLEQAGVEVGALGAAPEAQAADEGLFWMPIPGQWSAEQEKFIGRVEGAGGSVERTRGGVVFSLSGRKDLFALEPPVSCDELLLELRPKPMLLEPCELADFDVDDCGLSRREAEKLKGLDASLVDDHLDPWWYERTGDRLGVRNRNVDHPHNGVAVDLVSARLRRVLGNSRRHAFRDPAYRWFENVYGDIAPDPTSPVAAETVLLGAHIDCLAIDSKDGCAPGLDDDASGVAGVLAAAEVLAAMSAETPPRRRIRFAIFNCEERGKHGSAAFAGDHVCDDGIVAAFQLDMIGWVEKRAESRVWEVHTGDTKPNAVRPELPKGARRLGLLIEKAFAAERDSQVTSPDLSLQPYPGGPCTNDEGALASDHSSFMANGCPACLVCEDFFTDQFPCGRKEPKHYHKRGDVCVDSTYAADVARVVAGAVWMRANAPEHKEKNTMKGDRSAAGRTPMATAAASGKMGEFIGEFLSNPVFRFAVLRLELTETKQFGLSPAQADALWRLDPEELADLLKDDVLYWGADLVTLYNEIHSSPPFSPPALEAHWSRLASAMYDEGKIFILHVDASGPIKANTPITLRGVGFDRRPQVRFQSSDDANVYTDTDTDVATVGKDLYQRVPVVVPALAPGDWLVYARNDRATNFDDATARWEKITVVP